MRAPAILASSLVASMALPYSALATEPAETSSAASAKPRAAYVQPGELDEEGTSHLFTLAMVGSYARAVDGAALGGVENVATFGLRTRLLAFRPVAYCAGLDAEIGGSDEGAAYAATAYAAGLGARWGAGNAIALCGGAGVDGAGGAIPVGARFPAELSAGFGLGPIRPTLWLRPAWVAGASARREGTDLDFIDELEAGLSVRIGRQRRYWSEMSAGGGPVVGATYRGLMGTHMIGGFIGIELGGEQ
jgi:hypothetical protein